MNTITKRILILVFLGSASTLTFYSCSDLNLVPLDKTTTATFYKTSSDFDAAMFAAYSSMQDMWVVNGQIERGGGDGWGAFWAISLGPSDDVEVNNNANSNGQSIVYAAKQLDLLNFNNLASNTHIYTLYSQVYEGVGRANIVLEQVNNGANNLTDAEKKKFIAEAKFIRGFFHFIAAQIWNTAPLVTATPKSADITYSNSTPGVLLSACAQDFKDAADGLPASWDAANTGRATKWSAKAYEGKVYVWQTKWTEAIAAFEAVEASNMYSLMPNYSDNFAQAKENNAESIFEVQYGGPYSDDNGWVYDDNHSENFKASQGIARGWFQYANEAFGGNNSLKWYLPTQSLFDLYNQEPTDKRFRASMYVPGDADMYYTFANGSANPPETYNPKWSETQYAIKKYFGPDNVDNSTYRNNVTFNNERFFRYSELLLLHAEAFLNGGTGTGGSKFLSAKDCIDATRLRAGLPVKGAYTLDELKDEKRKELAFEPPRYFDMIRWNVGGAKYLPFPQSEIDRNQGGLKQN